MPKVKYQGSIDPIYLALLGRTLTLSPGDTFDCSDLEASQLASDDVASKRKGRCLKWLVEKPKPAHKGKE